MATGRYPRQHQELLLSTVASYHGLAMSAVTIHSQKLYYREQCMTVRAPQRRLGVTGVSQLPTPKDKLKAKQNP